MCSAPGNGNLKAETFKPAALCWRGPPCSRRSVGGGQGASCALRCWVGQFEIVSRTSKILSVSDLLFAGWTPSVRTCCGPTCADSGTVRIGSEAVRTVGERRASLPSTSVAPLADGRGHRTHFDYVEAAGELSASSPCWPYNDYEPLTVEILGARPGGPSTRASSDAGLPAAPCGRAAGGLEPPVPFSAPSRRRPRG